MLRHFDHVTIVVRDVAAAKRFFALLGFCEDKAVVISGETFARYMGVDGIEADHVTLVHESATPRLEVQILHYRHPEVRLDPDVARLDKIGFNHVCFAVDDVEADVQRLVANGVALRNEVMMFHDRKLVFLVGPEGITIELAQWQRTTTGNPARHCADVSDEARIATLRAAYAAFNRRDVDGALAMLAPDVEWPDMMEDRVLHGTDAVRAYWTRQFALVESRVEPLSFESNGDRILIVVEQRVRRVGTDEVETRTVGHLYTFRGARAARMVVYGDPAEGAHALRGDTA